MIEKIQSRLENSLYKGFIDQHKIVPSNLKPKLLSNKGSDNVLNTLLQELNTCKSFIFSVAFITEGGLATLKTMLYELQKRGIKGRILTSTFLSFNHPKTFKELLKISNLEVRLSSAKGFHSKGYIFEHDDYYSLIVGSSNLTDSALKANFEWNIYINSMENGEVIQHFHSQFNETWNDATPLTEQWILDYQKNYIEQNAFNRSRSVVAAPPTYITNPLKDALMIQPNKMQTAALQQLMNLRATGANKGLIISATGTGKTYLSAFDIRNAHPEKVLFVVHREQILKKAMSDFKKVLGGNEEDYGILSGNSKELNAKYLFATVQTISKDSYLQQFAIDHFDYILIDEVHRAGAESYLKIISHFKPAFLLGMTATPERTDNFNIYELFDYNIAYEIRLQEALAEDMLCPFHYFGVVDYEHDGQVIDETATLQKLISNERVNHIIEKISYYGYSGEKIRGLMFCSSKEEAKELSTILNYRGFSTTYLTGDHSQDERENAISKLERGELQYILTIDIFNEGIDIPFINQIVMLRQTQSSIIFIQQLGRGLRKHDEKEYVTIIDFIGNYKNNFLIPMALSGDKSLNKDNIRRKTVNTDYIKGVSTINFEEIAKKRIFDAISNTNLSTLKNLKDAFVDLKNKLNKIPTLFDFIQQNSIDPEGIVNYANNYYDFLLKIKEEIAPITTYENAVLSMISKEFINGKRIHELVLLEALLNAPSISKDEYIRLLEAKQTYVNKETLTSVERIFSLQFHVQNDFKKYGEKPIIIFDGHNYSFNTAIKESLQKDHFKNYIVDVIQCGYHKNTAYLIDMPLTLNKKYSRRDVCRLLNWENDSSSTIYGYRTKHNTTPLFVTYHKNDETELSQAYGDEFISPDIFKWFSRNRLTTDSTEVKMIINHEEVNNTIYLFVKKNDGEGTDFYYLGTTKVNKESVENTTMPDKNGKLLPVVSMNMVLDYSTDYNIYHYLVEE